MALVAVALIRRFSRRVVVALVVAVVLVVLVACCGCGAGGFVPGGILVFEETVFCIFWIWQIVTEVNG